MSIIYSGTRQYQVLREACQVGNRRGNLVDGKSNSCEYPCVVGTVRTQNGNLVAIEDDQSCCKACDSKPGFPWWLVAVAAVAGFYVGRK